jgi:hypothetical protein
MPVKPYTEDELAFLAQLDQLPDELELNPEQVAIILGVTIDWLKKKRQGSEGAGPPFVTLGNGEKAPVRYPLGALRDWQKERKVGNTRAAKHEAKFRNISTFMANANLNDEWPFVEVNGRPVDALSVDIADPSAVVNLTLDVYLERVRNAAREASQAEERKELGDVMATPQGENRDWRTKNPGGKSSQ